MMRTRIFAAVALLVLPFAATGAERNFSYSFLEIGYADSDLVDEVTADEISADGHRVRLSREFSDVIFLFVDYQKLTGDVHLTTRALGAGAAFGLGGHTDVYTTVGLADSKLNWVTETGYAVELGLRQQVGRWTEIFGAARYVDIYEEADTGFELGARYWFNDAVATSLSYQEMDEDETLSLAIRFNF